MLAVGRVVNVFLPLTLGKLVGVLEKDDGTSFWPYLLTYIGLRFLQSNGGIGAVRDVSSQILDAPTNVNSSLSPDSMGACDAVFRSRYASILFLVLYLTFASAMSQLAFDHLLNLSLSFHVHRKTGEVLRILDRGAAINRTLEVCTLTSAIETPPANEPVAYPLQHHSHICRHYHRAHLLRLHLRLDADRCYRNCHVCI